MKRKTLMIPAAIVAVIAGSLALSPGLRADEKSEEVIKQVMKDYHKAPKGTDPVCKKALNGKATPEELKNLVTGYKKMAAAEAPKGDAASWKDKTTKLLAAAEALEKGAPDGVALYKEAVNCKACHTAHKPD